MCRNIRVLHSFEPPTTKEIHAAALQYVRKVSGVNKPSRADTEAFERAIEAIAASTSTLLGSIAPRAEARTRELEQEKARARWRQRLVRNGG